jgi:hypothetical protein
VAVDGDGLESAPSVPIEVESEGYALSATARKDGVHLEWRMRSEEGYVNARVIRRGFLRDVELGSSREGRFVDATVSPNGTYRYIVVLEKDDGNKAAASSPVEIHIPDS